MTFNQEEISKLKSMLLFLVKKKHKESDGHSGFHINELEPVLKKQEEDGEVETHPTINTRMYFLKNVQFVHNDQNDQQ